MDALRDAPLLAAPAALHRPAIVDARRAWTWGEVHAQALVLSERLPRGAVVCNLCDSRLGFMVTTIAALRLGCVQVLPPSAGPADLHASLRAGATPVIVVDTDAGEAAWSAQARCVRFTQSGRAPANPCGWEPQWDAPAMQLFTSGSTGVPEAHVKTLGQLVRGARELIHRLDESLPAHVAGLGKIVCSVAPQHMFGLESSVMLPLVAGTPVCEGRPLLPADVREAVSNAGPGTAWIATPLHLRAFAQSGLALPSTALVLVSTMPMSQPVAAQAEAFSDAPVLEIYGSTETGALAMRRTAREPEWRPLADVTIEPTDDGTLVRGEHFASPLVLADRVQMTAAGRFELLGRDADMVKIAGRRASLASLNLCLADLPGLADGALVLPRGGSDTQRLVLFYSGPRLVRADVRRWLRERMDSVFVPREIIHVARIPRTASGKIAVAELEQFLAAHRESNAP